MPNHVANVIRMDHIQDQPLFSIHGSKPYFDFNKIIPMPESLNIESSTRQDLAIDMVLRKLNIYSYSILVSMKDDMTEPITKLYKRMDESTFQQRRSYCKDMTDEQLLEFGIQLLTNKMRYGAKDWYDWSWNNWGTKWNSYDNRIDECDPNEIGFNTAWGAPHEVIQKLAEMYPRAIIQHWWAEEFLGSGNSGYMLYKNGEILGGYDQPMSYDSFVHSAFCWQYTDQYIEPSNAIFLLGDGNVLKRKYATNVFYYIQDNQLSYEEFKRFYRLDDGEDEE